jgi:drug/metabolite transporter (DMT)-like permease
VQAYVRRYGVTLGLIAVAAIWGATFVIVADAVERYPVFGFLAWRFAVAAVAFVLLFPRVLKRLSRPNLTMGLLAGLFLTLGYIFQTAGLAGDGRTTPARAAFITGLYVVVTPLLQAVVLRRRPHTATLVGGAVALVGLWLLSGFGLGGEWVLGDTLVVVCAVAYSVHMIVLGSTTEVHDVTALTLVQLLTAAVATGIVSVIFERPGVPTDGGVWLAIIMTGVLASAVAFAIQTYAQRHIPPARTALILVTEPAFGGVFGWMAAGMAPVREVVGAAFMLGGMVTSELWAARAPEKENVTFEPAVEGIPAPLIDED